MEPPKDVHQKQIALLEYCREGEEEINGKKVKILTRRMEREDARKVFPYRPYSKYSESLFGGDERDDDIHLIVSMEATWCGLCNAPTRNQCLHDGICPDCERWAELEGVHLYHEPQTGS